MSNRGHAAAALLIVMVAGAAASAQSLAVTARTNPQKIVGGGTSVIAIRVTDDGTPVANQEVRIEVIEGQECGTPDQTSATTGADGTVTSTLFRGGQFVENCVARLRVTAGIPAAEGTPARTAQATTTVTVNPDPGTARIDGLSALALVVVVAFAIDRLVRGLLFALSYWPLWSRRFPDPALDDTPHSARHERNRRLIYFVLAGSLAMVALGWFGGVRLLAALGFTSVNPWLDVLVTGLILAGGADRVEQILRSAGASGPAADAKPAPIEITGRLIIDEQGRAGAGPGGEPATRSFVLGGSDPPVGV